MIRARSLALAAALLACVLAPASASAVIHPASVLDGPANDIIGVDGAAMAPDGSGGVLYTAEVEGVTHLFAIPFAAGSWGEPVEVDREDAYGASEPAIAAGEGGRLLVVWVQPRSVNARNITEYELMGASLQPGAGSFGPAVAVDTNVGEPDTGDITGVDPRLAMAPDGAAYVVYRVIADDCGLGDEGNPERPKCRSGTSDEVVYVRVARFDYLRWSSLGTVNRAPQLAMLKPTLENAPSIGIGVNGNGVVAWQEPDDGGVARIWVRRLFGVVQGNVLQASPETIDGAGGRPITSNADSPVVAVGRFGEARIAYRIQGAPGSAVATSQIFLNSIESEFALHGASQLTGATPVSGTAQDGLGQPSAAIVPREEAFRLAWTQAGTVRELAGSSLKLGSAVTIGASAGQAYTTINPAGGGTTAWTTASSDAPAVGVREDYAQGAYQTALLTGTVSGPVADLSLGGDGQGDALLGWLQGPIGDAEVVGDFVQAPPGPFIVSVPLGWVAAAEATIGWEAPFDARAGLSYTIYVDGKPRIDGLTALAANLGPLHLGDGVHQVQVLATDAAHQQTMSGSRAIEVDASPPTVTARLIANRRGVHITVRDRYSGVDVSATRIAFGDGHEAHGRASVSHVYGRPGLYTVVAQVRDNAGNHATVHLRVRVE
jgi:hypothetical protein